MKLSEEEIRKITLSAINELGEKATPELVKTVVVQSIEKLEGIPQSTPIAAKTTGRLILTAFGLNKPGIIAAITKNLAELNCDIQDMSQKILGEFFTVIMIVDITASDFDMKDVQTNINNVADELKFKVYLQHEDLFRQMHRI